jgi:hypothetical protein
LRSATEASAATAPSESAFAEIVTSGPTGGEGPAGGSRGSEPGPTGEDGPAQEVAQTIAKKVTARVRERIEATVVVLVAGDEIESARSAPTTEPFHRATSMPATRSTGGVDGNAAERKRASAIVLPRFHARAGRALNPLRFATLDEAGRRR